MLKDIKKTMFDPAKLEKKEYGFYYSDEKIKFISLEGKDSIRDIVKLSKAASIYEKIGVICDDINERDLSLLRENKISYIINGKEIKIFESGSDKSKVQKLESFIEKMEISPTVLNSPTGLEIIDVLLQQNKGEIQKINATVFCKQFKLSRPKLSQLMNAFDVSSLEVLKNKILLIKIEKWLEMFNRPITKRKMTPFKNQKTRRYVLEDNFSLAYFNERIEEAKDLAIEVEIGGLTFLQNEGLLRSNELDLVVRADQLIDLVQRLPIRPAKKNSDEQILYITPLIGDIDSERLYSKVRQNEDVSPDSKRFNILRMAWGLNYEESRIQELRKDLLEKYFNAVKKNDS